MFLRLHPGWDGDPRDSVPESQKYFRAQISRLPVATAAHRQSVIGDGDDDSGGCSFLETPAAAPFLPVFRNIRLPHLVNHHMDVEMLVADRIIPAAWMASIYYTRWMTLLRIDSGKDIGPQELSEEVFNRECLRSL